MSKQVVYISDFFANQVLGGAELNDQELLNVLKRRYEVIKINSHLVESVSGATVFTISCVTFEMQATTSLEL